MKTEIDLKNKYRVLLTEVLPYELPLMLNNEAFYLNMQDDNLRSLFIDVFSGVIKKKSWSIPFDYDIRRVGGERSRKMSIMHPITQLDCVEHYAKYDTYMINLCSHSPFSIRYINKIARCVFPKKDEQETLENGIERHVELFDDENDLRYRSYFSYKKYDLVYKFFESGDNLRLEQKYPHMMVIDIAGCFYHIYTHSIAWAIKGKPFAKSNVGRASFENDFDTLMQHTNYNETNGIIVGPEISRIFAEIILQSVDLDIMKYIKEQYNYRLGHDYEIRRYVDDSFIYAKSHEILENIHFAYQEKLAFYKLEINKSKVEFFNRPFTTGISDAKRHINRMVEEFKEKYLKTNEDERYTKIIRKDMNVFTSFVKQFRSITHQFHQNYGALNKYTLTLLLRQIRSESKRVPSQELLTAYTEIAFFIFSLDMHTTASYRMCSILDCLVRWSELNPDFMVKQELINRIRREAKRILDIIQETPTFSNTNLEVLNLLITLNRLIKLKAPINQIESLFKVNVSKGEGYDKLNYLQICTILYVIENDEEYRTLKEGLENDIISRLSSRDELKKSEMALLFFDLMTCPFVKKTTCTSVIKNCLIIKTDDKASAMYTKLSKPGRWFFDWDKTHNLTKILNKKEYRSPYE